MPCGNFPALIEREGDGYVSLCPELDIASQGNTVEEAKGNLIEAVACSWIRPIRRRSSGGRWSCSSPGWRCPLTRLAVWSGREVCRVFRAARLCQVRRRGSHIVMQKRMHGTTITVPIPDHHEKLRIGTLRSIIRQAELSNVIREVGWEKGLVVGGGKKRKGRRLAGPWVCFQRETQSGRQFNCHPNDAVQLPPQRCLLSASSAELAMRASAANGRWRCPGRPAATRMTIVAGSGTWPWLFTGGSTIRVNDSATVVAHAVGGGVNSRAVSCPDIPLTGDKR